jgi:hypothetical protein
MNKTKRDMLVLFLFLGVVTVFASPIAPQQALPTEAEKSLGQPTDSATTLSSGEQQQKQENKQPPNPETPSVPTEERPLQPPIQPSVQPPIQPSIQPPVIADVGRIRQDKKGGIKPSNDEYYEVFTTFMHTQKNILAIKKAYAIHEGERINSGGGSGLIRTTTAEGGATGEELEEEIGEMTNNVYLNSIFFISPNNWSVWVNGKKMSDRTNGIDGEDEFFVEKIGKNEVTLIQRISRGMWRILNKNNPVSDKYNYRMNNETNKIELIVVLHPNQTFVVTKNQVFDGRYNKVENLEIESADTLGDEVGAVIVPAAPDDELNFDELFNNF